MHAKCECSCVTEASKDDSILMKEGEHCRLC